MQKNSDYVDSVFVELGELRWLRVDGAVTEDDRGKKYDNMKNCHFTPTILLKPVVRFLG